MTSSKIALSDRIRRLVLAGYFNHEIASIVEQEFSITDEFLLEDLELIIKIMERSLENDPLYKERMSKRRPA